MNDLITKSFGNYIDLKKQVMKDLEAVPDVEMGIMDPNLENFFLEANDIKENMEDIKKLLMKLQKCNDESKSIHKAKAIKTLRDKMDKDIVAVLKKTRQIKGKLEALDENNKANRKVLGCEEGTPTDRTKISVTNGLRKKLKDLMTEFQNLRKRVIEEHRETVERRYFTVTGEHPNEEVIEKIMVDGDSENFLKKAVQMQGRGQVYDTINEIQERHDATKEIEKNLLELHQIFLDMAVLVESQAEQLNDIEHHVIHAANYVGQGTKQLKTAKDYQRGTRKCMCIGVILLLVLVLIIVLPIISSFRSS